MLATALLLATLVSLNLSSPNPSPASSQLQISTSRKQLDSQNWTANNSIFGVRWALGNHFSLEPEQQNSQKYILMFNSYEQIQGQLRLELQDLTIDCNYSPFHVYNTVGHLYRCIVNETLIDSIHSPLKNYLNYCIINVQPIVNSQMNTSSVRELFSSKFRPITNKLQPLFLGQLQVENQTALSLLTNTVQSGQDINLFVLMGNFKPNLTGINYHQLLLALQPITSTIALLSLNLYQVQQLSQLFVELFYTPMQAIYHSYLWLISMPNNIVILAINPNIFQPIEDGLQYESHLSNSMANITKQLAEKQNFIIAMLSNDSHLCDETQTYSNITLIHRIFEDISINMYWISNNPGYCRSQLCSISDASSNKTQYSFDYPVIINEGEKELMNESQANQDKYLAETGFGVLSFAGEFTTTPTQATYSHYSFKSGAISDNFSLNKVIYNDKPMKQINFWIRRVIIAIELILILSILTFIVYATLTIRAGTLEQEHIQMVQELRDNQQIQLRQQINP